jgi:hypothetical protein
MKDTRTKEQKLRDSLAQTQKELAEIKSLLSIHKERLNHILESKGLITWQDDRHFPLSMCISVVEETLDARPMTHQEWLRIHHREDNPPILELGKRYKYPETILFFPVIRLDTEEIEMWPFTNLQQTVDAIKCKINPRKWFILERTITGHGSMSSERIVWDGKIESSQ